MIKLHTNLDGKTAYFGPIRDSLKPHHFCLGGNWEYDKGYFDSVLWRENGETIYLRMPFHVLNGELDHYNAYIQFDTPYVIKHIVNFGLDRDENSLLSATGFNQFQKPIDRDAHIRQKNHWEEAGEQVIEKVVQLLDHTNASS
ncbi:MAG TPA: YugN family protein [Bacillota bacterium]|nr:YugN family protein [Bacillota bacterium]